jgi:hypothetical protein
VTGDQGSTEGNHESLPSSPRGARWHRQQDSEQRQRKQGPGVMAGRLDELASDRHSPPDSLQMPIGPTSSSAPKKKTPLDSWDAPRRPNKATELEVRAELKQMEDEGRVPGREAADDGKDARETQTERQSGPAGK